MFKQQSDASYLYIAIGYPLYQTLKMNASKQQRKKSKKPCGKLGNCQRMKEEKSYPLWPPTQALGALRDDTENTCVGGYILSCSMVSR